MSQSVSRTDTAVPPRFAKSLEWATPDRQPAIRPAFSRALPVASGHVAGVTDKGVPIPEFEARARAFDNLNSTGSIRLDAWATRVPANHVMNAPEVSELTGGQFHNAMLATRMPNGGVEIRPTLIAAYGLTPNLLVQRSDENSAGVEFKLNGRLLTDHSPMADIRLAINLVELL